MYDQGYGNEQAMMTMNRAAYGDIPAAMMGGYGGGAGGGLQNMMTDVGRIVMPVSYSAPFRPNVGFYGTHQQNTGFFGSGAAALGFTTVPRGTQAGTYAYNAAGDFGERAGAGLVGAGVTGMSALAMSVGLGSTIGSLGGGAIGSTVGLSGVGAAIGGFAAPIAAAMYGAKAVTQAVEERRQIQGFLEQSSFRFVGAGSSMADPMIGSGMNRSSRQQTAEFLRGMDVNDKSMGMGDLTQILKQGSQLGLFNGSQDMQDFQRKFKDITESVKTVTKVLNQTLEEGMKTIADLKGVGIDPSRARSVVAQSSALGAVAGRTGQEMIGLGLQGAEMFRGTGVSMGVGFQASQMNLASVRAARDFGTLSQEAISQAGGEEALALRMSAGGLSFAQSTMGRGFGAAFTTAGGALNTQGFMQTMMQGGGNFLQNVQAGATNLSSPAALISFQANQAKFMSDMGSTFGGRGLEMAMLGSTAGYAEYISSATGAKKEDSFRLALLQQGKSNSEVDAYMAQIKDPNKMFKVMQAGVETTATKAKIDAMSENSGFNRIGAAVGDVFSRGVDVVARPANAFIDDVAGGMQNFTMSQVYGAQAVTTKGVDLSKNITLTAAEERQRTGKFRGANLNEGGWLGGRTAGETLASVLSSPGMENLLQAHTNVRANEEEALSKGETVLRNERGNSFGSAQWGFKLGVSTLDAGAEENIMRRGRMLTSVTSTEAAKMAESGALKDVKGKTLAQMFASGRINKVQSGEDLLNEMFGRDAVSKGLSKEEMAFAISQTEGTQAGKFLNEARVGAQKAMDVVDGVSLSKLKDARESYNDNVKVLEHGAGTKLAPEAIAMMIKAKDGQMQGKELEILAEAQAAQAKFMGPNASAADVSAAIRGGYARADVLSDTKISMRQMQLLQQERGATAVSRLIESELASDGGAKLSVQEADMAGGFGSALSHANSPAQIKELLADKDAVSAVSKLSSGNFLVQKMKGVAELDEKLGNVDRTKSDSREKYQEILKGVFSDKNQLAEAMRLAGSGKMDQVTEMAMSSFKQSLTTEGGIVSGAGAASTSQDPDVQGAARNAETQLNINIQTLSAMQGLAKKLGVN